MFPLFLNFEYNYYSSHAFVFEFICRLFDALRMYGLVIGMNMCSRYVYTFKNYYWIWMLLGFIGKESTFILCKIKGFCPPREDTHAKIFLVKSDIAFLVIHGRGWMQFLLWLFMLQLTTTNIYLTESLMNLSVVRFNNLSTSIWTLEIFKYINM